MVNIPPLVFFYRAAKIGVEIQTKKAFAKGIWNLAFGVFIPLLSPEALCFPPASPP